jgi:hypothetical protein
VAQDDGASLRRTPDIKFASLKLLEECLLALGFAEDQAIGLVAPLREAHDLHSKVKGHASGNDGIAIKKQILKDHGWHKKHLYTPCQQCDESIRVIAEAFGKLG